MKEKIQEISWPGLCLVGPLVCRDFSGKLGNIYAWNLWNKHHKRVHFLPTICQLGYIFFKLDKIRMKTSYTQLFLKLHGRLSRDCPPRLNTVFGIMDIWSQNFPGKVCSSFISHSTRTSKEMSIELDIGPPAGRERDMTMRNMGTCGRRERYMTMRNMGTCGRRER